MRLFAAVQQRFRCPPREDVDTAGIGMETVDRELVPALADGGREIDALGIQRTHRHIVSARHTAARSRPRVGRDGTSSAKVRCIKRAQVQLRPLPGGHPGLVRVTAAPLLPLGAPRDDRRR